MMLLKPSEQQKVVIVSEVSLTKFVKEVCLALKLPSEDADILSKALVYANLRGVDSHGVVRLPIYVERFSRGSMNPCPTQTIVRESSSAILLDGDNGIGHVVAHKGMVKCIEKARKTGVAIVVIRNSNHFGCAAWYVEQAIAQGMIGVALSNGPAVMAPAGACVRYLGTNPLSIGFPSGSTQPVIVDMATSVIARGSITLCAKKGLRIPADWALDSDGNSTTDPNEALAGAVLPMAGHKGSALALAIDFLAGALSGAKFGPHVKDLYDEPDFPMGNGHFLLVINVGQLSSLDEFERTVDREVREIKSLPKAKKVKEILVPGENEKIMRAERLKTGIPVPYVVWQELLKIAKEYQVDLKYLS